MSDKTITKESEIEENDFKLVFSHGYSFDLYLKSSTDKWKLFGYSMPMEACIKTIAQNRLNTGKKYNLSEFISEYKQCINELKKLLNGV